MNILVFGAGSVGGYLGAKLANAGHQVTLVARDPTATAIQENGLTIIENGASFSVHPMVVTSLRLAFSEDTAYDVILICVKSYDVETAINELVAFCPDSPPLITLQNGIGIEELFIKEFGAEKVIAGSLTTPLSRETSQAIAVQRIDRGLALSPTKQGQRITQWVELFQNAGINTVAIKRYQDMKWSKAMLNMVGNATSAILNRHPKLIYEYGPTFRVEKAMLREMLAVMNKKKIKPVDLPGVSTKKLVFAIKRLPNTIVQPILTKVVSSGRGEKMPSFHIDLTARKPDNEVRFHNGAVAQAGRQVGVETPVNTALTDILLKLAKGKLDFEIFNGNIKQFIIEVRKYYGTK
ncbi:MAG: ketopantoate reductase family protein [Candidatus Promineifilaceae bacterium]